IEIAMTCDDADALIVIFTPVDRRRAPETLAAIREGIAAGRRAGATGKTVLACVLAEPGALTPLQLDSPSERVPVYAFPENCARALGKIASYAGWRSQPPALFWSFDDIQGADARDVCGAVLASRGGGWLTGEETRRILNDFGLPLVPTVLAQSPDDAAKVTVPFGFPVGPQ